MPTQRLSQLLASATFSPLCDESRRIRELQRVFLESAPPSIARAVRVKLVRAGTLYLSADNVAIAAKLRQMAPRLLQAIRERVPEVNGIRVQAQVSQGSDRLQKYVKKAALSPETIENFDRLAAAMRPSEAKSAVAALVRHHRTTRT
jgi:hypothetical protein